MQSECVVDLCIACRQHAPRKKQSPDDWDAEYDKGKVKKVKSKRGGPDAWQQGINMFGKIAVRGRGRGGLRGGSGGRHSRDHHHSSRGGGRGRSGRGAHGPRGGGRN